MDANIGIICFKSKVLANGEHPLMLRISQGKLRYFKSLGISIKASCWNFDKEEPKRNYPNREQLLSIMNQTRQEYVNMMFELKALGKDFTPQSLAEYVERSCNKQNVGDYIQYIIQYMTAEKRLGNAKAYISCYNSAPPSGAYCCGICVNVIGSCFERCRYGGDAPRRLLRLSRVRTVPCPEPGRGGVAARGGALRIRRRLRCARRRSARFRRAA